MKVGEMNHWNGVNGLFELAFEVYSSKQHDCGLLSLQTDDY